MPSAMRLSSLLEQINKQKLFCFQAWIELTQLFRLNAVLPIPRGCLEYWSIHPGRQAAW